MVTEAGKELLRNTINTANFHNKILEENEMWKQWELERGLTMMVSDDDVLKSIRKHHRCAKHRKTEDSKERRDSFKSFDSSNSEPGPSKSEAERWDHSGFLELYPDEVVPERSSPIIKEHSKKHKEKKKKKHHSSVMSDDEIYQEFKEYKRKRRSEKERLKLTSTKSRDFDKHVKEWKKRKVKNS